jgi:hypothetical protein
MPNTIATPKDYIATLPPERAEAINKLIAIGNKTLKQTELQISYGMLGFVIPHSKYPEGYHCNPSLPLPFISIASQKNFIALYHMGIYADAALMEWFVQQYPLHCTSKLDMGKSCIRFKKTEDIPYQLIEQLFKKMSAEQWITIYNKLKSKGK